MKIERLVIENFKSIERIELIEPNSFTVFVGPNGSGKSNIFEALEFVNLSRRMPGDTVKSLFGGDEQIVRRQIQGEINYDITCDGFRVYKGGAIRFGDKENSLEDFSSDIYDLPSYKQLLNFTRLFIGNDHLVKLKYTDNQRLSLSASNMETVLKRLLSDQSIKEELYEWLGLFIPEFKGIDVIQGSFDGKDTLLVYEQHSEKPFTKSLISDGTYNIITLLTALYQSDEPQFLCIEEPENGLHPQVIMSLTNFFRKLCEQKGHYIWLNTHSEALVRCLSTEEIILVDKEEGKTLARQKKGKNIYNIPTDEAWLTGTLGGGLPW